MISPAPDASAANWLLPADIDWQTLVRYGPPGFATYARIALREDSVRATLAVLASCTATPDRAYAAIWEGWLSGAPQAPRVEIPERSMLLFTGPVEALRDAPAVAWFGEVGSMAQEPHLVWPEDHAWCLACEVDEEVEFTVGSSPPAFEALTAALPGQVRRIDYAEPSPLRREP